MITQANLSNPKNQFVCPKTGIIPTFLFFSDGIGTQNILLDRNWLGFFFVVQKSGDHHLAFIKTFWKSCDFNYQPQLVQEFFHQQ